MKLSKPTLLISEEISRTNIQTMLAKARRSGVELRPHFKTHQSRDVGEWFRDEGVRKITVSSVTMAEYFAECGWQDITIAFPYNPLESASINQLAEKITLNILIESNEALDHLNSYVKNPVSYWIKIDVGTHRTGVTPDNVVLIKKLAQNPGQHQFAGLLAHAGHSYTTIDKTGAREIYESAVNSMNQLKKQLGAQAGISYGDTPTCSLLEEFPGIDELRPGNFTFYDIMQHTFGVCDLSQIAACMICPVVATHPDRNEVVIYGGGVHFSKDSVKDESIKFGVVVPFDGKTWIPKSIGGLVKVSQEHGIFRPLNQSMKFKIGDLVGVLPVHACLTADLQGYYLSLSGQKLSKLNRLQ